MQLPTGTSFYGTGEVGGPVERSGKRVRLLHNIYLCQCLVFILLPLPEISGSLCLFLTFILTCAAALCRYIHGTLMHGGITRARLLCINLIHGSSQYSQMVKHLESWLILRGAVK